MLFWTQHFSVFDSTFFVLDSTFWLDSTLKSWRHCTRYGRSYNGRRI